MNLGFEFSDDKLKTKLLINPYTRLVDFQLACSLQDKVTMAHLVNFNGKEMKVSKFQSGLIWQPSEGSTVTLKHESPKDGLCCGKTSLQTYHKATENSTLGSEFALDCPTK